MAGPVFIERELIKSKAFRGLTATAIIVLMDFMARRQFARARNKNKKNAYTMINNGEITYSYAEAESKGITRPAFQRAIDLLMSRGFISIAHRGSGGKKGDMNLFNICNDWRSWEEGEVIFHRPKDKRAGIGFARMHYHKNKNKKQNIDNVDITPTINVSVTSLTKKE